MLHNGYMKDDKLEVTMLINNCKDCPLSYLTGRRKKVLDEYGDLGLCYTLVRLCKLSGIEVKDDHIDEDCPLLGGTL